MDNFNMPKHKNMNSLYGSNLKNKQHLDHYELTEKDFYPPEDTRIHGSGIDDIAGGDNFADYAEWFYNTYEDELFDS